MKPRSMRGGCSKKNAIKKRPILVHPLCRCSLFHASPVPRLQWQVFAMASAFEFLHEISSRIASADALHAVLDRIVDFVSSVIPCDSCFIYVLEQDKLVLRASKNPHADVVDRLDVRLGQGITGWVAQHREPVAIAS